MTIVETYYRANAWHVRVHGGMLIGAFKTQAAAQKHGEWFLRTQCLTRSK